MTIQEKAIEQLERISSHLSVIGEKEDYTDIAIHALEQTSWIPVSERLPEEDEWVLITFDDDIEIASLDDDGWCYSSVGNDDWIAEHPPVAWMPLPDAYKESEDKE